LITNIANDDLKEQVADLFQLDADWNKLLSSVSDEKITEEKETQRLLDELRTKGTTDIDLDQLQMKISTRLFSYYNNNWNNGGWRQVLDSDNTIYYYSESERIMVLIEKVESNVGWSTQKDIIELDWNL